MQAIAQITRNDLVELRFFQLLRSVNTRYQFLAAALLPPLASVGLGLSVAPHLPRALWAMLIIPVLYLVLFYQATRRWLGNKVDQQSNAESLGSHALTLHEDGIQAVHASDERFISWDDVVKVVANTRHGYIFLRQAQPLIVPLRCFPSEEAFRLFMKLAIIYHWNNHSHKTAAPFDVAPSNIQPQAGPSTPLAVPAV